MRIAIVHYSAPPVVGGVEAVIEAHTRLLMQGGYHTTVITGRGDVESLAPGAELVRIPEIDSLESHIAETGALLEQGQVPPDFEETTRRIATQMTPILGQFDHVIFHNILTKHFNLPLTAAIHQLMDSGAVRHGIAWCHDFTWTSPASRSKVHEGYPWDLLRTYRPEMTYVVVSERRQKELADLLGRPPEDIHVIYNGIQPESLLGLSGPGRDLIARLGLLESDLTLLMPFRVTRAKNIEYALHVVKALKSRVGVLRLVISGPPDPHSTDSMAYFEQLKTLRKDLDITDEARFVFESGPSGEPFVIGADVVGDLFRVSDLIFIPSLREGFGMPVLEAGLAGIPVMSTDIPATREIGGGDVMSFSVEDAPEQVADRILAWSQNSPQHHLRRRVRRNYTWDALFRAQIEPLLVKQKREHLAHT